MKGESVGSNDGQVGVKTRKLWLKYQELEFFRRVARAVHALARAARGSAWPAFSQHMRAGPISV